MHRYRTDPDTRGIIPISMMSCAGVDGTWIVVFVSPDFGIFRGPALDDGNTYTYA